MQYLPFPNESTFKSIVEKFSIHQTTRTIINRGWPTILRTEDHSGPSLKISQSPLLPLPLPPLLPKPPNKTPDYNLRTTNTLQNDTALSLTHIPADKLTYAIAFGYTESQIEKIFHRLADAEHALLEPFTLINAFIQLEKIQRFEQVERFADDMADLIENFRIDVQAAEARLSRRVHEDDPQNLVGVAAEMRLLRNALVSWGREMGRFGASLGEGGKARGDFAREVDGDKRFPLLDAGEYLERTVDEYAAVVRKCEGMLEQVSMTFQMVSF